MWADMIGVGFDIDEAITIREHAGRVNEVTWSKVQATSATIARTQAYALRQLDALAEKMEGKAKFGELAEMAKEAESKVQGWLVLLARCAVAGGKAMGGGGLGGQGQGARDWSRARRCFQASG